MKVLGIEFASDDMNYVIIERTTKEHVKVCASNRLSLRETRSPEALRAFQQAIQTLLTDTAPARIAIKDKPERGTMRAGSGALKMEALVLATAHCDVQFVSGARINQCSAPSVKLKSYHHPAYKAALCAANDE